VRIQRHPPGGWLDEHGLLTGDAHHVHFAALLQPTPKLDAEPVARIGDDRLVMP